MNFEINSQNNKCEWLSLKTFNRTYKERSFRYIDEMVFSTVSTSGAE